MPPPGSTIVAAADDVDSLYYNPFAASSSTSSFSSAYTPRDAHSSGAKPTLRRRGSDAPTRRSRNDHDPFAQDAPASPGAHARARTMDAVVGSSSATNLRHPLAVSNLGSNAGSSRSSLTDTRPRLKRLLSDLETTSSPKLEDVEVPERVMSPTSIEGPKERVVIIHEASRMSLRVGVVPPLTYSPITSGIPQGFFAGGCPQVWDFSGRSPARESDVAVRPDTPPQSTLHPVRQVA